LGDIASQSLTHAASPDWAELGWQVELGWQSDELQPTAAESRQHFPSHWTEFLIDFSPSSPRARNGIPRPKINPMTNDLNFDAASMLASP
jgi:hypothetical protein